ncbi:MAG: hypothetical protein MZV70_44745 [Desulfobacterales bacterium]|nr:hypothetical protein [Desulfobacterales bacterium]
MDRQRRRPRAAAAWAWAMVSEISLRAVGRAAQIKALGRPCPPAAASRGPP